MRKLSNAYTRHRILTHLGNQSKLPRGKGFDDAIQMLAQASVKMLPKCKLYTANGHIPRCARHGAECRLNWCKYKYSSERAGPPEVADGISDNHYMKNSFGPVVLETPMTVMVENANLFYLLMRAASKGSERLSVIARQK